MKRVKWISILFWGLIFCSNIDAQSNERLYDLLTKLKLAEHDSSRMDLHTQLANLYISEEANAEKGLNHANLAFILAQNYKDSRRQLLALDKLIKVYYEVKYDLPTALNFLNQAKAIDPATITLLDRALLYGHEGKIFMALNHFEKSQSAFYQQLSIYENSNYEIGIAKVTYDLGMLFFEQNDFQRALEFFQIALRRYNLSDDIKGKIKTLNSMGKTFGQMKDFNKNLTYSSDALLLARTQNDKLQLVEINANIGYAYEHLDRPIDALGYFNEVLRIGEEIQNNRIIAEATTELGNIYHRLCDETKALSYYDRSLKAAKELDSKLLQKNIYETFFLFHDDYGRDAEAFYYLKKLTPLKDELYNEERTRQLINNQIRYETEKREEEVKQLKARELENQLTIQNQRVQNYALLIITILVLAAAMFLYNAFRRKKAYNKLLELEVKKRTGELERSNYELVSSNSRLEQSNNELERFAYIASHDLKSPLRNIISFLNLIERKLKRSDYQNQDIKEYLRFATDNAKQMHHLIQDVLEFSRIDRKDRATEQVDMNDSMTLVMQNLQEQMQHQNAIVYAQALPIVKANSVQVLQLLQNLIGNGIKYNKSNQPKVIIGHRADNSSHVFSVIDNGIGIDSDYHQQIFQMFKRLHTKEEYQGTGIGLALCKKIVHNMGGEIWLESKQGKGTTFYFSIPQSN